MFSSSLLLLLLVGFAFAMAPVRVLSYSLSPATVAKCKAFDRRGVRASDLCATLEAESKNNGVQLNVVIERASAVITSPERRSALAEIAKLRSGSEVERVTGGGVKRGETILEGRYEVLTGSGQQVSSGKSRILDAVEVASGRSVKLKITTKKRTENAIREAENFRQLGWGLGNKSKPIIGVSEFSVGFNSRGDNVLVLEAGETDLFQMIQLGGPIRGKDLRLLAAQLYNILRYIHSKGLVWSDCKLDNIVIVDGRLKAIDLESAVKVGGKFVDYTPAITPPEMAANLGISAQQSVDAWSLGMILLHTYQGRTSFGRLSDDQIMAKLRESNFQVDLSCISDDKELKMLLEGLLQGNPGKRLRYFRGFHWYLQRPEFLP